MGIINTDWGRVNNCLDINVTHRQVMKRRVKIITPDDPNFLSITTGYSPPKKRKDLDSMSTYRGRGLGE